MKCTKHFQLGIIPFTESYFAFFSPYHLIHHTNITLNNLDYLIRYIDISIIRYRDCSALFLSVYHFY